MKHIGSVTKILAALLIIFIYSSCNTYKSIPYFQGVNRSPAAKDKIENYTAFTIQKEDVLSISVSSRNPEAWVDNNKEEGYLVDQNGEIQVPLIGTVQALGLTTTALQDEIKKRLLVYLKQPMVNVRVTNFKVAVLGDVGHPDVYKIQNERITVIEAISMAGDLNITGLRNNVLLIREIDGNRQYINIDLTSADIFHSPYYYLKNNDVLYVQPDKNKTGSADRGYRTATLILSVLSFIAIVYTSVKN